MLSAVSTSQCYAVSTEIESAQRKPRLTATLIQYTTYVEQVCHSSPPEILNEIYNHLSSILCLTDINNNISDLAFTKTRTTFSEPEISNTYNIIKAHRIEVIDSG